MEQPFEPELQCRALAPAQKLGPQLALLSTLRSVRALFILHRRLLGLSWFGLLVACSEEDPAQVRQQQLSRVVGFCEEWARLACNALVVENCAAASIQDCVDAQEGSCRELLSGREYNPDFADYCLQPVQAAFVDARLDRQELATVTELGGRCAALSSLGLTTGETCSADLDCDPRGALMCRRAATEALGVCASVEIAEGGFRCDASGTRCAEGFFCDGERCLALARENQPCSEQLPCGAGLGCQLGECTPRAALGAPCESGEDCASELCLEGRPAGANLCAAALVLSPAEPLCESLR